RYPLELPHAPVVGKGEIERVRKASQGKNENQTRDNQDTLEAVWRRAPTPNPWSLNPDPRPPIPGSPPSSETAAPVRGQGARAGDSRTGSQGPRSCEAGDRRTGWWGRCQRRLAGRAACSRGEWG